MRSRRTLFACLVVSIQGAAAGGPLLASTSATDADVMEVRLVLPRPAYPVSEPVHVSLDLKNGGSRPVTIPGDCLRPSSFHLRRVGDAEEARARKNRGRDDALLDPGRALTVGYDLARHFKALAAAGRYGLSWSCGAWGSRTYEIFRVLPYDPERDRVAVVETTLGTLELVLMPEQAPHHVETFVQLARQGYYDGTLFHRVMPGMQVEAGLRQGEGGDPWVHQLQAEIDPGITPGKGLVGAVRRESSMTSATQFFILLNTIVQYKGFHTFFAYVRAGQEVLDAFNQVEVLGDSGAAAFRPAQPIAIERIEIRPE